MNLSISLFGVGVMAVAFGSVNLYQGAMWTFTAESILAIVAFLLAGALWEH